MEISTISLAGANTTRGDCGVNAIQHRHAYLTSFKPIPGARKHDVRVIGMDASPRRDATDAGGCIRAFDPRPAGELHFPMPART